MLGIDRYDPPHQFGSSHAESRITRLAVGEGEQYLPFVARSHELWRELEQLTGEALLHQPGGYIITPPTKTDDDRWGSFVDRTADVAASAGISFERHGVAQVAERAPALRLQGDEEIGFEPTGGIVMCERAIAMQLALARSAGADMLVNTPVDAVEPGADVVKVTAAGTQYVGSKVIVATGAWFPELAPPVDAAAVRITRQVVYWFEVDDLGQFGADRFPFVIWPGHTIDDYSAVFPIATGARPALKVLGEQFDTETTAESVDRQVSEAEVADFYERLVAPRLHGVTPNVVDTAVCLYTNTADDHFLIDVHPESSRVMFASPCSGHGFKHSTAIGEAMVAALAGDEQALDLAPFVRS